MAKRDGLPAPVKENWDVTFIIPTYKRPDILGAAIRGLIGNITYTMGSVRILIGNDWDGAALNDSNLAHRDDVHIITGPKKGLGANLNMLLHAAGTKLVFQMDDDHILKQPIDLDDHAKFLMNDPIGRMGWIRLMFGHSSERTKWPRDYYHFKAVLYKYYWRVLRGSEFWVPSNRPHLKHIGFHKHYGYYEEDRALGDTEYLFCQKWQQAGEGGPQIFIPFNPPHEDAWEHVGESWQHTEHDRRRA